MMQWDGFLTIVVFILAIPVLLGVSVAVGLAAAIASLLSGPSSPPNRGNSPRSPPEDSGRTPPPKKTPTPSTNPAVPVALVLVAVVALGYLRINFPPSPMHGLFAMGGSVFMVVFPIALIMAVVFAGYTSSKRWQTYLAENAESARLTASRSSQKSCSLPGDVSAEDRALMGALSISFDGSQFTYSGYRYDHLKDAIAYARLERGRSEAKVLDHGRSTAAR